MKWMYVELLELISVSLFLVLGYLERKTRAGMLPQKNLLSCFASMFDLYGFCAIFAYILALIYWIHTSWPHCHNGLINTNKQLCFILLYYIRMYSFITIPQCSYKRASFINCSRSICHRYMFITGVFVTNKTFPLN